LAFVLGSGTWLSLIEEQVYYLIGTPVGIHHYVERHELGLFTTEEMTHALTACGLEVTYDETGLTGRGLYIGQPIG
jgi:hypothetical protein